MITNISDHKGVKILSYNNFNFNDNGNFNLSTKQLFASWSLCGATLQPLMPYETGACGSWVGNIKHLTNKP